MPKRNLWRAVPTVAALAFSIAALGAAPAAAAGTPVQTLIADRTLYIGATNAHDLMLLRQTTTPSRVTLDMGADGVLEGNFPTSLFDDIDISLEGGTDRLLLTDVQVDVHARGGAGNDDLNGGRGADVLEGGTGRDKLAAAGDGKRDTLLGGPGEDNLYVVPLRGETVSVDGGTEVDKLIVDGHDPAEDIKVLAGTSPDRATLTHNGRIAATDIAGVERVRLHGGGGDDTLAAPKDATSIVFDFDGGPGNDLISGSPNNDLLTGGPGQDRLRGGSGNDEFSAFTGDLEVSGGLGDDTFQATYLTGVGETGTSILVDGGPGTDRYSFAGGSQRDGVSLKNGTSPGTVAVTDHDAPFSHHLAGVESGTFELGGGNDDLVATPDLALPLTVDGGSGSDNLATGAGNDTISGNRGTDQIWARGGDDSVSWAVGFETDNADGGAGNDMLTVTGSDVVDTYTVATPGNLPESVRRAEDGARITIPDFERVRLSLLEGNDQVTTSVDQEGGSSIPLEVDGGPGDDLLGGGRGADVLDGGDGADELYGQRGNDNLRGGAGDDFVYWDVDDDADVVDGGTGDDQLAAQTSYLPDDVTLGLVRGGQISLRDAGSGTQASLSGLELVSVKLLDGNDKFVASNGIRGAFDLRVDGGPGRDDLVGGDGDDLLSGGPGFDELDGRGGADTYQCAGIGDWFVEGPGDIVSDDCR
ncbi:calcium-binding protein [Tenggerimyces flavus]|uniref:Calcium-binding protein n=1 Tax=Tenggerimyces flavus TaxID=1708749 RepID=A0ABV7YGK0_9ACTN|nr:hypothetical protein [Tenggerimyces flavus]MBM7784587.1 Ca2+-binding RTX toxin-like protein [Tenggerimyces flavus]